MKQKSTSALVFVFALSLCTTSSHAATLAHAGTEMSHVQPLVWKGITGNVNVAVDAL